MIRVMASDTGTRIRTRRQQLRLTQAVLAKRIGVHESTVLNWEKGRHFPSRYQGAVEAELGISLSDGQDDRDDWYDRDDPVESALAEDPRLPRSEKLVLIAQLRARRLEHLPRAHEPPAL
jgi:transcriptional regulator with XRE-family HTH domain